MNKFKKKEKIIGGSIVCVFLFVSLIVGYKINSKDKTNTNSNDIFEEEKPSSISMSKSQNLIIDKNEINDFIVVEIKGEVKKPNIYTLPQDSRVNDIVIKAGGFTEKANKTSINLAQKLKDEDCLIVSSVEDNTINFNNSADNPNNIKNSNFGKININKAPKEELKKIPGVGEVTADKIIQYRETNKGFNKIEDIKNIDRIGEKTFEKMKDSICVR